MARLRAWCPAAVLAVLCACGGGGGGGGPGADLTGAWFLTPATSGVDGDTVHATVTQTGTALRVVLTCNATAPVGTGSWDGTTFLLSFDAGGGSTFSLSGGA